MPESYSQFHHIGVVVRDLETSIAWYQRHFDFRLLGRYSFPGAMVAFVGCGDLKLELFQVEGAQPMSVLREQAATNLKIGGINHFAILVDDLDQVVAELASNGVEIAAPPRDVPDGGGDRFAFIRDNERMLVELYQLVGRSTTIHHP